MKYIDSDKLKGLVEELKKRAQRNCYDSWGIVPDALEEVEGFIASLQQEQPNVDGDFFFDEVLKVYDDNNKLPPRSEEELTILETIAQHFYELGMSVMRERITNPNYNQKVVEKIKSEYPVDESNARKEE